MDKKLEFALQYAKAPKELQASGAKLHDAIARSEKADNQYMLWFEEKKLAARDQAQAQSEFDKGLSAWSPEGAQPSTKLEDAPAQKAEAKVK